MKIKLAMIETDTGYLDRFVSVFSTRYADKFEIYSFTDAAVAAPALSASKIDVVLVSDSVELDMNLIPKRCGVVYLVDSMDVESLNDLPTICRYQKVDLIYKQILSIYSEHAGKYTELKNTEDNCKVIAFTAPSGGAGASTMAAACALHLAAKGLRTLYLNLERFGAADDFFSGDGQFSMSDVIYALKTKKANLTMKLESCVKRDARGVFFFSQAKLALDMLELKTDETLRLLSELRLTGSYDRIILDVDFDLSEDTLRLLRQTGAIVLVGDGSPISNTKVFRAVTALSMREQSGELRLTDRTVLAYNKFSSKMSAMIKNLDLRVGGGAPRYEHATVGQMLAQLSKMALFDEIDKC